MSAGSVFRATVDACSSVGLKESVIRPLGGRGGGYGMGMGMEWKGEEGWLY